MTAKNSSYSKHTLTQQVNNAIVDYVTAAHARGECPTFAQLYDVFDQTDMSGPRNLKTANTPLSVFRSRLQHLIDAHRLQATGKGMSREFSPFSYRAITLEADPTAPYVDAYKGTIVPPRQFDVMHGALYIPESTPPARARSLDYKRVPSVGYAC